MLKANLEELKALCDLSKLSTKTAEQFYWYKNDDFYFQFKQIWMSFYVGFWNKTTISAI